MKTAQTEQSEKEVKGKGAMKESLLLPCTSAGKTTSASIAERSNVWAENKLQEKMSVLDKKLYKSIVKMNTDKLEVVHELSKLKKSSSTGALERLSKDTDDLHPKRNNGSSAAKNSSTSSHLMKKNRNCSESHLPLESSKKTKPETLPRHTDSKAKITITVGGDSSSDEQSEDEKKVKNHTHENKRTLSLTSCSLGRECSASRSELRKFENATKRYARVLSAKAKSEK